MNRCKTCERWEPCAIDPCNEDTRAGGICRSDKLTEDWGQRRGADMLVYAYSEGGSFWTGPDFGCVHHEPAVA
jgi:hypothetical protein